MEDYSPSRQGRNGNGSGSGTNSTTPNTADSRPTEAGDSYASIDTPQGGVEKVNPSQDGEHMPKQYRSDNNEHQSSMSASGVMTGSPQRGKDLVNEAIFESLAALSSQIKRLDEKLDAIESTTSDLKGELSRVDSRVQAITTQIGSVKDDLKSYDEKWEARINDFNNRLSQAEKKWQSAETKWEKTRTSIYKDQQTAQSSVDSNSSKIIELAEKVQDQNEKWGSIEKVERKIIKAAEERFEDLKTAVKNDVRVSLINEVRRGCEEIKKENRYEFLKGKASANKQHLVLLGIPENPETGDREYVAGIFKDRLGLQHIDMVETFRLGNRINPYAPRPLAVKFTRMGDRIAVWKKKSALATVKEGEPTIWIQEYVPKQLRNDSRVLQRIAKVAKLDPESYGDIFIRDYQVFVNGRGYSVGNIRNLPRELQPEYVYTPRTEETVIFFTKYSPLSNHHRSPFTLDGTSYNCVELLADNQQLAERAMKCSDLADHKVILNTLKKDTQEQWRKTAEEIIPKAIRAKFSQNPQLAAFLVETFPRAIGEASTDKVWGIGRRLEDKDALQESAWEKEGNLLGKTLSQIRQEIMNEQPKHQV